MSVDFAAQRVKMVDGQLRTTDVTSLPVLEAFLAVPREAFVPSRRRPLAYIDEDIEITPPRGSARRFLMAPSPLARLVQLAGIRAGDVVLEIGAGSGYASAILSRLAGSVIALESDESLAEEATGQLARLGCDNVAVVQGALTEGYPSEAPYDVVFVGGAVDQIPEILFGQLRDGGRLVAVEGHGNAGVARLHVRDGGAVSARRGFNAAVKPLPGFERARQFEF